ncbi:MAG: DEAD/DEAH box helicase family protein [Nanoarchaeota archaeon]|nr:DEAD/DEAH box helicase family protein [Nanoarchaeota archaeon]
MWNLYSDSGFLEPLRFSNEKTQEDIVREVIELIEKGEKIIFIRGMCGTGKSAIALNIARNLGKTSIVVPGKNLQNQYKKDYEKEKYLLKDDGEKLRISIITGRNNHECAFIKDNESAIPRIQQEINSKLSDVFAPSERDEQDIKRDKSADNPELPCKIEIKEKNFRKIREYLRKNKNINPGNILQINDVKRLPLASVCPYWSPVLPEIYEPKNLDYTRKREYLGLNGTKFIIYQRRPGCGFYEQFNSYIDSDVIVFNSLKYKLESALNRKPFTEAEIIDECDEFLDGFTNERHINLDRLQNSLIHLASQDEKAIKTAEELNSIVSYLRINEEIREAILSGDALALKKTGLYDLLRIFIDSKEFLEDLDEESYLFEIEETARMFEDFMNESFVIFSKKDGNTVANIVTTNLSKKFQEMVNKNQIIILMSGTLHSEKVLKEIFGLNKFSIVDAETKQPGTIEVQRTGMEFDCKYENFSGGKFSREDYLRALDKCIAVAKKPVLIHVSAFSDLPTEWEISELNLENLQSKESLIQEQSEDKNGEMIQKFKRGETKVLFTTKCARGVDFPGEQCNSIVFTKYPNPNPSEPFWKILKKTNPNQYWDFYKDKAKRELLQKVYRGTRFMGDHVFLLSPDVRVLREFEE